ncbi:MAG TPA: OsmC family protein [Ktedonobacteraceae bacterium]
MAPTTVHIRTVQNACVAVGWAGHRTLTIDRETQAGGMGLGFNGGELLLLAIGGCYCNDLFREAARRGIVIQSVQVVVAAEWGGEPVRAQHVALAPRVEAEANEAAILDLITSTDRMAEIPNSLRLGTPVRLRDPQAIPVAK